MKIEEEWDIGQMQLFLRLLSFGNLNGREIKYLMWHYGQSMPLSRVIKYDGLHITKQAINCVLNVARNKIKRSKGPLYINVSSI